MKICFISSCMYGSGENEHDRAALRGRRPVLPKQFGGYDFYLFTNVKDFPQTAWNVIYLSNEFLDKKIKADNNKNIKKNIYRSRYPKFMGWEYIKEIMKKDYDIIFYCDINIKLYENFDWQKFGNQIINNDWGLMQSLHPCKNTAYMDMNAIQRFGIDDMTKMATFLQENNMDRNYIITQNNIFGYNPKNEKILSAFTTFWDIYTTKKLTYRDQPLWGYISWKLNIKPVINNDLHDEWKKLAQHANPPW